MIDVAAVLIGATVTVLVVLRNALRPNKESRAVVAVGVVVGTAAFALALYDFRLLGFVVAIYWLGRWVRSLARRLGRQGQGGGQGVVEPGVDRSAWPTSGPIGALVGQRGSMAVWTASQLLVLLNPWQVLEICRQIVGNTILADREERSRDDGRGYRTRAVYTLPFVGEWFVISGGHTRKTSHSWEVLGQRFALDFVQVNEGLERHTGRGTHPEEYFCYGEDILAAAEGTVVRVESGVRRAFLGWGFCDFRARSFVGNHVLIEHAPEEFALYAHLIRDSVTVMPGDRVERGQVLGRCGHTGHSSEPHLHFHLQDSADLFGGMGLPVRFSRLFVDGESADEVLLTAGNRVRPRP